MTLSEKASAITLVLVLAVVGLKVWGRPDAPTIPPTVTATIDSLERTAPVFDSVVTNTLAGVDRQAEIDRRLARRERALRALADTLKARKDSLALDASQHPDSALAWRRAYVAADSEATARRTEVDTLRARIDTLTVSRDSLRALVTVTLGRLDVTSGVVVDLRAAIVKANACRVGVGIVSVPCPSRRTAFVGGLVVGGVVMLLARR